MRLTERQIEVLRILLVTGDTARIAKELRISRSVVTREIAEIYRHVQIKKRRQLLPLMLETGSFVLTRGKGPVEVGEEIGEQVYE